MRFHSRGLLNPRIKPASPVSPALDGGFFTTWEASFSEKLQSRLPQISKGLSCISFQLLTSAFKEHIDRSVILRSSFSSCPTPPNPLSATVQSLGSAPWLCPAPSHQPLGLRLQNSSWPNTSRHYEGKHTRDLWASLILQDFLSKYVSDKNQNFSFASQGPIEPTFNFLLKSSVSLIKPETGTLPASASVLPDSGIRQTLLLEHFHWCAGAGWQERIIKASGGWLAHSHKLSICCLLFSHSVMSDSLQPHGLQHTRLPCPSPSPGVCSDSCPSNHLILCHPLLLCLQSFPASGSFQMSWLFASGGRSIGASVSVLPMIIQGWFPLGSHHYLTLDFITFWWNKNKGHAYSRHVTS